MLRFKSLRNSLNLTLKDLSKKVGLSPQVLSRYELGITQPDFNTLISLANFYDVSIDYLLGRSDYYYPDKVKQTLSPTVPALTPDEAELLERFRAMSRAQKVRLNGYIDGLLGADQAQTPKKQG